MKTKSQIGIIGLAVMGSNLARNFASRKISTLIFNRTFEKTEELIRDHGNEFLHGSASLKEFVGGLELPRKIILMVKAGDPVDMVLKELLPLLNKDDIVIDGGNSFYKDTERRQASCKAKNIHFLGMGISGGEEGALHGPSMMPGGAKSAYKKIEKYVQAITAKDYKNGKCVAYIGEGSSGHFVKMVHNGIEYAIMQLIAETYDLLKNSSKLTNDEIAETFKKWGETENFKSFLLEITAKIFTQKTGKKHLIDLIKDSAGQKGTGKWTTIEALHLGVPTPAINTAVDARIISGDNFRESSTKKFPKITSTKKLTPQTIKDALELGTLVAYSQGFRLLEAAYNEFNWKLDLPEIARIWTGGCIIRSDILPKFELLYKNEKAGSKLLLAPFKTKQKNWRSTISASIESGIPVPTLASTLFYYDSLSNKNLPQNLIQAQRDFFGAHGYERIDKKGQFHTEWF